MSTRQIRRLREQLEAAKIEKVKQEEEEIADFEPLYVNKNKPSFNLPVPDTSERKEHEPIENATGGVSMSSDDPDHEVSSDGWSKLGAVCLRKKRNSRKKKNKSYTKKNRQVSTSEGTSEDEIDQAVSEVNSILGAPVEPSGSQVKAGGVSVISPLLKVNPKQLSMEQEFDRRFGPDDEERRSRQRPDMYRLCRRHILLPNDTTNLYIDGLNMVLMEIKGDIKYFKFEHSTKYQENVRELIADVKATLNGLRTDIDSFPATTIEAMTQNIDLDFGLDQLDSAIGTLEAAIACLQNHFCASFNYFDGKTRLEYKHVENRPFHICLLKYVYMISRRGCHRTALEICKLLLSLDPSDPLAVIFVMDTLALRAREHQWLVDIYQHWEKMRDAKMLFHLEYSHALAKYHIYLKTKKQEDLDEASEYLMGAMIRHPNVAFALMSFCSVKNPTIAEHEHFNKNLTETHLQRDLTDLQDLYVMIAGYLFREGKAMKWFTGVALKLIEEYDTLKDSCIASANLIHSLFRKVPIEIKRHQFSLKLMSTYLFNTRLPMGLWSYSFNPYPLEGNYVDAPGYFPRSSMQSLQGWRFMLASMIPNNINNNNDHN